MLLFVDTFEINRERAIDYLNTRDNVYVFDGYAGVCFIRFFLSVSDFLITRFSGIQNTESRSA